MLGADSRGGPGSSPPVNSGTPVVTGTARQGQTLTTTSGGWTPTGTTYTYLWQSLTARATNWTNVTAATGTTYTPTAADAGSSLRVAVTATNSAGTASASSNALGPVLTGAPAATSPPVITATARQGQTLTTTSGSWNPTGTTCTYLWQRLTTRGGNWTNIAAATKTTYIPTAADVGASLRAAVTATNRYGGARESSNVLGPVAAVVPAKTAPLSISDSPPSASPSSASAVLDRRPCPAQLAGYGARDRQRYRCLYGQRQPAHERQPTINARRRRAPRSRRARQAPRVGLLG